MERHFKGLVVLVVAFGGIALVSCVPPLSEEQRFLNLLHAATSLQAQPLGISRGQLRSPIVIFRDHLSAAGEVRWQRDYEMERDCKVPIAHSPEDVVTVVLITSKSAGSQLYGGGTLLGPGPSVYVNGFNYQVDLVDLSEHRAVRGACFEVSFSSTVSVPEGSQPWSVGGYEITPKNDVIRYLETLAAECTVACGSVENTAPTVCTAAPNSR
jgi:hypothetical protein